MARTLEVPMCDPFGMWSERKSWWQEVLCYLVEDETGGIRHEREKGEVNIYNQHTCFPSKSVHLFSREYLLELIVDSVACLGGLFQGNQYLRVLIMHIHIFYMYYTFLIFLSFFKVSMIKLKKSKTAYSIIK